MTTYITVSCDGILPSGMTCRGRLSTKMRLVNDPIGDAAAGWGRAGWMGDSDGRELCPSCARRELS